MWRTRRSPGRTPPGCGSPVELVTLALSLLAALITALAAVNIAQAFHAEVRERTREIGVMRAVGATRGDVATLILAEAAVTGIFGGAMGILLARVGGLLVDRLARTGLPQFPFKPETFFGGRWSPAAPLRLTRRRHASGVQQQAARVASLGPDHRAGLWEGTGGQ